MRTAIVLALALSLTGCAGMMGGTPPPADRISFDRGAFALLVADVGAVMQQQCKTKKLDATTCARVDEQYREIRRQIMTPPAAVAPAGVDLEQMMKLLGVLIGAAS